MTSVVAVAAAMVVLLAVSVRAQSDVDGNADDVDIGFGTYNAAVLEWNPAPVPNRVLSRREALEIQMSNVQAYESYIVQAKANDVNIMVFSEYGLQGWPPGDYNWTREMILPFLEPIPDPENATEPINPCRDQHRYPDLDVTIAISCLARKYRMALVVDVGDVQRCSDSKVVSTCSNRTDGRAQYNTALAFDEDGVLLTKYHKRHLYFESDWYDVEIPGSKRHFTPQFGVTFGVFICADIVGETSETYTDFAFPTWWDNYAWVGHNATEEQIIWSGDHSVNFLAANDGDGTDASGSGIYTQGKPLAMWNNLSGGPLNKFLWATVPRLS